MSFTILTCPICHRDGFHGEPGLFRHRCPELPTGDHVNGKGKHSVRRRGLPHPLVVMAGNVASGFIKHELLEREARAMHRRLWTQAGQIDRKFPSPATKETR